MFFVLHCVNFLCLILVSSIKVLNCFIIPILRNAFFLGSNYFLSVDLFILVLSMNICINNSLLDFVFFHISHWLLMPHGALLFL